VVKKPRSGEKNRAVETRVHMMHESIYLNCGVTDVWRDPPQVTMTTAGVKLGVKNQSHIMILLIVNTYNILMFVVFLVSFPRRDRILSR